MNETMELDTPIGDKVIFAFPNSGWDHDIRTSQRYLKEGEEYTVSALHVGSSCSYVFLEEFPNIQFNTVQFKNK